MNTNIALKLDYKKDEVVPAQRLRFLYGNRLKTIIVLVLFAMIVMIASQIRMWLESGTISTQWYLPITLVFLMFCGVFFVTYFFAPLIDFQFNPQWHHVYDLILREKVIQVILLGQSEGPEMSWDKIKRVLENDEVYILFWGSEGDFIILPKRVLQPQIDYFLTRLNRDSVLSWKLSK